HRHLAAAAVRRRRLRPRPHPGGAVRLRGARPLAGVDPRRRGAARERPHPRAEGRGPLPVHPLRRETGWGDRLVTMYVGTHGMAHGLHHVLAAAKELRDDPDKLFVLVGEGAEKDNLRRLAAEWALPNVQFIDQQPKARVPLFYAACDLGLVTLRD